MRRKTKDEWADFLSLAVIILAVVVVGVLILLMVRLQRGLLGLVLSGLALGLLFYWLRELRRTIRIEAGPRQPREKKWTYELLDSKAEVTLVAEMPSSVADLRVTVSNKRLEITGSEDFRKLVNLSHRVEIAAVSLVNGVLHVRCRKLQAEA